MTLILVRHGQSRGNLMGTIQGWLDEPLTEAGLAQAQLVAARLAAMPVTHLYASPLARAFETARVVSDRIGVPLVAEPGMREHGFGEAQGLTWVEATERWGLRAEHDRDWSEGVPGAEPMIEFRRRVGAALDVLLDRHEHDLAVCVTHGGTISQAVAHVLGLPGYTVPSMRVDNTSLTIIDGVSARPQIRTLNDACHVGDAATAVSRAF